MLRPAFFAAACLALSACATDRVDRRLVRPSAQPSEVIAAELAFARAAREKGTWTAFREYATGDALWPAPKWANVGDSLKGAKDPAQAIVWGPDMVWSSCDGSFALSTGPATYPDGRRTRFATVWQRQNNGDYRWVLDQGFDLESDYTAREMISARVADCPPRGDLPRRETARRGEAWHSGQSDDGSLAWRTDLAADCTRTFVVSARKGETMNEVFRRVSTNPPVPAGGTAPAC